jgi:hypothetical protein
MVYVGDLAALLAGLCPQYNILHYGGEHLQLTSESTWRASDVVGLVY